MTFVQSLVLFLSVTAKIDAFIVGGNSGSCLRKHVAAHPQASLGQRSTVLHEGLWIFSHSNLQMSSSTSEDDDDSPWYSNVSIPYAAALGVFIGFATFLAPGEFGAQADNAMIQAYIDNPVSPGLNPIFNAIFNLLGAAPLVLSTLVYPQASPKGLTPAPFLAASAAVGYGGLGILVVVSMSV